MMPSPVAVGAVARLRAAAAERFHLHDHWRVLIRRAWSFRLALLAASFDAADVVCSVFVSNPPIAPAKFAALAGAVSFAACIARLFAQQSIPGSSK